MTDNTQYNDETIDMLDETLDDLADMPSQKPFPAGAHFVSVVISRMDKKPGSYVVNMTYKEPIEMGSPNAEVPAAGDKSAVFIHTKKKDGSKNEFGQGQLKMVLNPIGDALQTKSISEILEATKNGMDAIVVVKVRKSKDDNYDDAQDIVKLELPA